MHIVIRDQPPLQQQQQQLDKSNTANSIYMHQFTNPITIPITATITAPTPTISPIIYVLIESIIVFILIVGYVLIMAFYENGFDRRSECKFGEPLSISPKKVSGQSLTHIISFNFNRMERICAFYEFGIVILLSLISNINVYFQVFDILYGFYCGAVISTIIATFFLRTQIMAFDSSSRAAFNDTFGIVSQFGLPTMNMRCGGIVCTILINNAINNYGYYQATNIDLHLMAMGSIQKIFAFLFLSLETYNSVCGNIHSSAFNTIANDIKYLIYYALLLVVANILFYVLVIPYSECGRKLCMPIFNIMFDNGVLTMKIGTIGNIACAITYTYMDGHNEKQYGQVSTNFDNIMDNNGYYQTVPNCGSNLALICAILSLLLSIMSSFNDNNSIITILGTFDIILNGMKGLVGVVLVVLISGFPFCALTIPICTSAREQTIIFGYSNIKWL